MDRMLENRFVRLFTRRLSGDATSEELEELEGILRQHPELQFFYNELIKPVKPEAADLEKAEQSYLADVMNMQLRGVWGNGQTTPAGRRRFYFVRRLYKIAAAAVVILLAGAVWAMLLQKRSTDQTTNETATTKGSKSTVKLPDGTVVMLNANSRLTYDENFKGAKRIVTLDGEAYFDVAHDAAHPFVIHTSTADITVLGTVFNVKSFRNGYFETALIKGKVSVYLRDQAEGNFILKPGQKLTAQNLENKTPSGSRAAGRVGSVKIDSITVLDSLVAETSWTKDRLVFVDKPLVDIAGDLEQVFDVKIVFRSDKTKQFRYNGVFSDADLNEILKILDLSKHISYHREKEIITIE